MNSKVMTDEPLAQKTISLDTKVCSGEENKSFSVHDFEAA